MRGSGARLLWLLVLSLAWLGPAWGDSEGLEDKDDDGEVVAEEEEEDEDDDVISDELVEEDSVLVLHEHNFARALSEFSLLLVEFCKCPGCGQGLGTGRGTGQSRECRAGGRGVGQGHGDNRAMGMGKRGRGMGRSVTTWRHRVWCKGTRCEAGPQGRGMGYGAGKQGLWDTEECGRVLERARLMCDMSLATH